MQGCFQLMVISLCHSIRRSMDAVCFVVAKNVTAFITHMFIKFAEDELGQS